MMNVVTIAAISAYTYSDYTLIYSNDNYDYYYHNYKLRVATCWLMIVVSMAVS